MSRKSFYYVLWIPQYQKENPHVLQYELKKDLLLDKDDLPPFYVRGRISSESRDIFLEYSIGSEALDKELIFKYIESDDRGFVIYKLELDETPNDFLCRELQSRMPNALYHYFKSFYHRHMFHAEAEDSLLTAYFSYCPVKWSNTKIRNEVVKHFILGDYKTKFISAYRTYNDYYEFIVSNLRNSQHIERMHSLLGDIYEQAKNTFNERIYCEFLLRSFPYCIDAEEKKEIRNSIRRLEILVLKIQNTYTKVSASMGLGFSIKGYYAGVLGVIIGVFGAIFSFRLSIFSNALGLGQTIYQSYKSANDIEEYKGELYKYIQTEMDSLRKEEKAILQEIQCINSKVDTINHNLHEIQSANKKKKTKQQKQ